ncbi:YaaC family protein [Rhodopseudomonas sp. NSM]|uniref:YaaC family protein n=1 Tax=Rhodopseudomonas sp. NSM TaxID=3457630 RepID=UPI004035E7D9
MLDEIAKDEVAATGASNQAMFDTAIDYEALIRTRELIKTEWDNLSKQEKTRLGDLSSFETEKGLPNLKSPDLQPARNLYLVTKEVEARLNSTDDLRLLPIDAIDFDDSVLELAESLENVADIRELYKLRKKTVSRDKKGGINLEEAGRLKNCFSQGRELYIAGKNGSLMVKPLNFFYALTAYAYGIIVLNNPLRFRKDNLPGSHGLAYSPTDIQAQFGGDTPRGTFSDLATAFPTQLVKTRGLEINLDCRDSLKKFYEIRHSVSLGTLLSLVPEMADYYKLTTRKHSRCYPLEIINANDARTLKWEFHIGDGESKPRPEIVENSFSGFATAERHGKIVVTIPATEAHQIKACIYSDIYGNFWFIDNPFFPVILPEVCIHFLITNMFSNIMRYRPDEWGSVLTNEVSSGVSLLTRHYFSSLQRKFFIIVLRSMSRCVPYVSIQRS